MKKQHTYRRKYEAHLGLQGDRWCIIPDQVAIDQSAYDGKTFIAITIPELRKIRVKLIGSDYGLNTAGTGDIVVRPVRWIDEL